MIEYNVPAPTTTGTPSTAVSHEELAPISTYPMKMQQEFALQTPFQLRDAIPPISSVFQTG
jgi:hypothetical protein